jgi:hypothetical protein
MDLAAERTSYTKKGDEKSRNRASGGYDRQRTLVYIRDWRFLGHAHHNPSAIAARYALTAWPGTEDPDPEGKWLGVTAIELGGWATSVPREQPMSNAERRPSPVGNC